MASPVFNSLDHKFFPVFKSNFKAINFSLSCAVINTESPQIQGELAPSPAMGVFQATFSLSDHFVGSDFEEETEFPLGPRQEGQLVSDNTVPLVTTATSKRINTLLRFALIMTTLDFNNLSRIIKSK